MDDAGGRRRGVRGVYTDGGCKGTLSGWVRMRQRGRGVYSIAADIAQLRWASVERAGLHGQLAAGLEHEPAGGGSKPHGGVQDSQRPMSRDVWRATQGAATQTGRPGARTEPSCSRLSNHARGMTSIRRRYVHTVGGGVGVGVGVGEFPGLWWRRLAVHAGKTRTTFQPTGGPPTSSTPTSSPSRRPPRRPPSSQHCSSTVPYHLPAYHRRCRIHFVSYQHPGAPSRQAPNSASRIRLGGDLEALPQLQTRSRDQHDQHGGACESLGTKRHRTMSGNLPPSYIASPSLHHRRASAVPSAVSAHATRWIPLAHSHTPRAPSSRTHPAFPKPTAVHAPAQHTFSAVSASDGLHQARICSPCIKAWLPIYCYPDHTLFPSFYLCIHFPLATRTSLREQPYDTAMLHPLATPSQL
ncbi:hypothetical protein K505DRAFT_61952 [Melanomma pulvis-pyrius CBS 109.77]|uniref:Uncharacterized protein n=1 Tax=Melanomma pulvis-pyrius CBS 109.77 TaxID=1314802 RepID=A0A6A6X6J8_9PLEO|nr:hypothetical protein K505DRAFT_61952 [Melanomma pulvis-pyrius CBS 109.77]